MPGDLGCCQIGGTVEDVVIQKCGLPRETVARMQMEAGMPEAAWYTLHPGAPAGSAPTLSGFADDARTAIQQAPEYFVWWYTAKSIGLAVVFAAFTFMLGRASVKR